MRRKRTQSVRKGMRCRASRDSCDDRSARSCVGMQFSTLCVARGRGASGKACDAERRTIVVVIVPHAPAWECRSRRSASPRGRRASGKACGAECRTIVAMIVPHAPAWECRSRRSASPRGRRASGKACGAECRTIVAMIVPHAPAWECSSRRSASQEDAERPERHATRSDAR
ncbi:hypothetical protein EOL67_18925 [Pseudomonas syringae pv. syringae]|nr:hypothetical protein EOL67_18925 [Pseudomonas syringae pv. syringae]